MHDLRKFQISKNVSELNERGDFYSGGTAMTGGAGMQCKDPAKWVPPWVQPRFRLRAARGPNAEGRQTSKNIGNYAHESRRTVSGTAWSLNATQ